MKIKVVASALLFLTLTGCVPPRQQTTSDNPQPDKVVSQANTEQQPCSTPANNEEAEAKKKEEKEREEEEALRKEEKEYHDRQGRPDDEEEDNRPIEQKYNECKKDLSETSEVREFFQDRSERCFEYAHQSAEENEQLRAQINALQTQVESLRAQLGR